MTLLPKVKLKSTVNFPAHVNGGTGIDVVKANGSYTIDLDYGEFGTAIGIPTADLPSTNVLTYNELRKDFVKIPLGVIGAGVATADFENTTVAAATMIPPIQNFVRVAGYAAAGDGGEALYGRVPSLLAGTIGFRSADGAWWQLAEIDVFPQMCGANDIATAVADAQIQAAINHVQAVGKGSVQLRGHFLLSAPLLVTSFVSINGGHRTNTILYPNPGIASINISTPSAVVLEQFSIQSGSGVGQAAITVSSPSSTVNNNNSIFRSLNINGYSIGIDFVSAAFYTVDDCQINAAGSGACIRTTNIVNVDAGDSIISNCWLGGVRGATTGIAWYAGGGLRVANCKILHHFFGVSINMTNSPGTANPGGPVSTGGMSFSNNNVEACSAAGFDFRRQGPLGGLHSVSIVGGHSAGVPNYLSIPPDANGPWIDGVSVIGVTWGGDGTGGDVFANVASVSGFTIANNTLHAIAGTTWKIIAAASADRGVIGPNIGLGTFTASSIASTNTTQIAPT
jgi:hypothetical protein